MSLVQRLATQFKPSFTRGQLIAVFVITTLVSSSVAIAYSVHKSRQYLNQLQGLQADRDHLETEWGQLLLEQHSWGAYSRVGKVATEQLQMRNPAAQDVIMVRQ